MSKFLKIHTILGLIIFLAIAVAFSVVLYRQYDQREIIRITREWARLADFPENAKIISVEKLGSTFNREFQLKFTAPAENVRKWLAASPGISQAVPVIEENIERYSIKPASGTQFAEVIYNLETNEIHIRVYWS